MNSAGAMKVAVLILAGLAAWATIAQTPKTAAPVLQTSKSVAPIATPSTELKFGDERIARVQGMLVGKERREYSFDARKGQRIALTLSSDRSPWIGMDLMAAPVFVATHNNSPAVYTNFMDGSTSWEGVVPANGSYTLRLGLLNAQARKAGRVDYQLDVNLR
ncbi:MAG: hypothetical protein ACJ8MH_08350 [Povalibacter sp.]